MSLTTNQGLELPDGTDNANVVLAMTNYNTGVESRLVQRYLSIADRTARNPTPFEGEQSWLADLNIFEYYLTPTGWLPLIPDYDYASSTTLFGSSSTAYTTVGATVIGVTLTAPASGVLRVGFSALLNQAGAAESAFIAPQLNAGAVIGAGATVTAATDSDAARMYGIGSKTGSGFVRYTGLTPGSAYNAFLMHRVTGSTGSWSDRHIEMDQK